MENKFDCSWHLHWARSVRWGSRRTTRRPRTPRNAPRGKGCSAQGPATQNGPQGRPRKQLLQSRQARHWPAQEGSPYICWHLRHRSSALLHMAGTSSRHQPLATAERCRWGKGGSCLAPPAQWRCSSDRQGRPCIWPYQEKHPNGQWGRPSRNSMTRCCSCLDHSPSRPQRWKLRCSGSPALRDSPRIGWHQRPPTISREDIRCRLQSLRPQ